jgi:hypothetical protein
MVSENNDNKMTGYEELIGAEKRDALEMLLRSDFESKLYEKIRLGKTRQGIPFRKFLIPSALGLITVLILLILRIIPPGKAIKMENPIGIALYAISPGANANCGSHSGPGREVTEFEMSLRQVLSASIRKNTSLNELSGYISHALTSGREGSPPGDPAIRKHRFHERELLKTELRSMSKNNDYSELVSGIIINLTEV